MEQLQQLAEQYPGPITCCRASRQLAEQYPGPITCYRASRLPGVGDLTYCMWCSGGRAAVAHLQR
jgi:hypothetical protein